jgi:hypothetical protein
MEHNLNVNHGSRSNLNQYQQIPFLAKKQMRNQDHAPA